MSETSITPHKPPRWLLVARSLLAIAAVCAGYLAWVSFHHGSVVGCGTGSGCDAILQSRWAYWLGLPVSLPACLAYLGLLGATRFTQHAATPDDERGAWVAIIVLSLVIVGAAVWFVALQFFVFHAFCKFCLAAHISATVAAIICLAHVPLAADPTTPMWSTGSGKKGVPRQALVSLALLGISGVFVLVGGQLSFQKQRNFVAVGPQPGKPQTNLSLAELRAQLESQRLSPKSRLVGPGLLSLYRDQFVLSLDELPMMGSPKASNIIVYLYDYSCEHCRKLHEFVTKAHHELGPEFGVVCLPMPLSTNCNPYFPPNSVPFAFSCDYARISLAVWRARPEAYQQFDDWLFALPAPVPVEQAKEHAAQLVGADKLEAALADPWIAQQIGLDCLLYSNNCKATDLPGMPQLIMGDAVSVGPLNSTEHLYVLLSRYLGMPVPLGSGR
jgi:uncharacterized membrane protein/protein-disulfide isomerase